MDPGDIIPSKELSQFFSLPQWVVFIGIFILGYIIFKLLVKKRIISIKKINIIDEIVLISAIGSIWFFRMILLVTWFLNAAYQYYIIGTIIMVFLGVAALVVIILDYFLVRHPKIRITKKIKQHKFLFYFVYGYGVMFFFFMLKDSLLQGYIETFAIFVLFILTCYIPINTLLLRGYKKIS